MLFNSQIFIAFLLPLSLATWYAFRQTALREWVMIGLSLAFYAYGDVRFLPLLITTILLNWGLGLVLHADRRAVWMWLGVLANLGVLGYFKYRNFFMDTLMAVVGQDYQPLPLVLPIGVSFFTFQHISFLVDTYRGEAPRYPLRRYALYVSFFPHLIAGPIVRHNEFIPQFDLPPHRPEWAENMVRGLAMFVMGLGKKLLLADQMAPYSNAVFAQAKTGVPDLMAAWGGALAYTLQIYFDFSAYTDMAIGVALMMGVMLPVNFLSPYRAVTLQDFWRRWHASLSRFLRDYLYFSMGGSRHGPVRLVLATLILMVVCGLWHGASWTFLAWGLLHGVGLVLFRAWKALGGRLPLPLAWLLTMLFVMAGWILFRAETFTAALHIYQGMLGLGAVDVAAEFKEKVALLGIVVILLLPPSQDIMTRWVRPWRPLAVLLAIALLALLLEIGKDRAVEFIYFQF